MTNEFKVIDKKLLYHNLSIHLAKWIKFKKPKISQNYAYKLARQCIKNLNKELKSDH